MRINRVRLQNIKSYVDQEISFHEGVNFISGFNGAGKSTIIEAIGYALFDYNPGTVSEMLRYGVKSGSITVDFTANDERHYRSVRKIGTSTLWAVYDMETDCELDLHGRRDVTEWLKEALGVDRDMELDQLFQDIIGVPQGNFVGPFLETQAVRKKKFDTILKVEKYREAYNNTARTVSAIKETLTEKETKLLVMAEQTRDYDTVKSDHAATVLKVHELTGRLAEAADKIKAAEGALNSMEEIKMRLDKDSSSLKTLKATRQGLLTRQADMETARQKAARAVDILGRTEQGYNGFLALEAKLKLLEARKTEADALEKKLAGLRQRIAAGQAALDQKDQALQKGLAEAAGEREALVGQEQKTAELLTAAQKDLAASQTVIETARAWLEAEDSVRGMISEAEKAVVEMKSGLQQLSVLRAEETALSQRLRELSRLAGAEENLANVTKEYQKAREEYAAADMKTKTLENNLTQSADGMCPFLGSPCNNVEGDLADYFRSQIAAVREELQVLKSRGIRLKDDLARAAADRDELLKLQGDRELLEQTVAKRTHLELDLAGLLKTAARVPLARKLDGLAAASDSRLKPPTVPVSLFHPAEGRGTDDVIEDAASFLTELHLFMEAAKKERSAVEQELTSEYTTKSGAVATLENEQKNTRRHIDRLAQRETKLKAETAELVNERQKLAQIIREGTQLEQGLAQYGGLAVEISATRQDQERHRQDYEIYMINSAEAGKLPGIVENIKQISTELSEVESGINTLETGLAELSGRFDPDLYQARKTQLDELKQEGAREKQALVERQKDLAELAERLSEMDRTLAGMQKLRTEIAEEQKSLGLLEIVRSILNSAGPPIARVYLENLSREATELYRQISRENAALKWREGYEIALSDIFNGTQRERTFKQFSGGEQMTAALAVRLALLKQQSQVRVGFFDEPTANLDAERRSNLAETIPHVTGSFHQIFVISHDDTFDSITENVIHLQKEQGSSSQLAE